MPKKLIMLYLRNQDSEVEVSFTEEDITKLVEKIMDVSRNIKLGNFSANKSKYCNWCDFKNLLCPEFG